jgi:hypothetical protein
MTYQSRVRERMNTDSPLIRLPIDYLLSASVPLLLRVFACIRTTVLSLCLRVRFVIGERRYAMWVGWGETGDQIDLPPPSQFTCLFVS